MPYRAIARRPTSTSRGSTCASSRPRSRPATHGTTAECVANHASRVGPAHACFRDCVAAAWRPLTVAPMLRPRRATCVRRRLLPVIRAEVGQALDRSARLMLCLWKQRCRTSTPTSSCTDSRTAPAMQRPRARRRGEWSSSRARASIATITSCRAPASLANRKSRSSCLDPLRLPRSHRRAGTTAMALNLQVLKSSGASAPMRPNLRQAGFRVQSERQMRCRVRNAGWVLGW